MSLAVLMASLPLACSGTGRSDAVEQTVRDSSGVRIVENALPLWRPEVAWRAGKRLTSIGAVEGAPEYQLFSVFDAVRLSDGTVAIANSGTSEIRFFNSDGIFVRSVGRSGGGPGEFRGTHSLRYLTRIQGDTLLAWDLYGQTLSTFDPRGNFVRSDRLKNTSRMYFLSKTFGGGVFSDRTVLLALISPDDPDGGPDGLARQIVRFVRFSSEGDSLGVFGEFSGSEWYTERAGEYGAIMMQRPFGAVVTVRAADDRVYVATGDSYQVAVYDAGGGLRMLIRREHVPVRVTDAMLQWQIGRDIADLQEDQQRTMLRILDDIPMREYLPPYRAIEVDAGGNIWVQEYTLGPDAANIWSVFDPLGRWLGTLTLPSGIELLEIGADYLLAKETDELDVEYVRVYELLKPAIESI